jgi:hypothetical protein
LRAVSRRRTSYAVDIPAGFTNEAIVEASRGKPHTRLMDLDQVLDAYVENYEHLRADDRARLPSWRVYVLALTPDEG